MANGTRARHWSLIALSRRVKLLRHVNFGVPTFTAHVHTHGYSSGTGSRRFASRPFLSPSNSNCSIEIVAGGAQFSTPHRIVSSLIGFSRSTSSRPIPTRGNAPANALTFSLGAGYFSSFSVSLFSRARGQFRVHSGTLFSIRAPRRLTRNDIEFHVRRAWTSRKVFPQPHPSHRPERLVSIAPLRFCGVPPSFLLHSSLFSDATPLSPASIAPLVRLASVLRLLPELCPPFAFPNLSTTRRWASQRSSVPRLTPRRRLRSRARSSTKRARSNTESMRLRRRRSRRKTKTTSEPPSTTSHNSKQRS